MMISCLTVVVRAGRRIVRPVVGKDVDPRISASSTEIGMIWINDNDDDDDERVERRV